MNIQIFGTNKCFDTKKAIRYFKERNIKVQFVDLKEKGLSKGEYTKVKQAVGGLDAMLNPKCKDKDTLAQIQYAVDDEKDAKVLANQQILKTPIVRNGTKATIGYVPEIWTRNIVILQSLAVRGGVRSIITSDNVKLS